MYCINMLMYSRKMFVQVLIFVLHVKMCDQSDILSDNDFVGNF